MASFFELWAISLVGSILAILNIAKGATGMGKIGQAVGALGHTTLTVAGAAMCFGSIFTNNSFIGSAGVALLALLAIDDFLNGNDPPTRRRRAWLKNKFAKLAFVHSD